MVGSSKSEPTRRVIPQYEYRPGGDRTKMVQESTTISYSYAADRLG